jgi:receptor expression-enhancing protein 5/6
MQYSPVVELEKFPLTAKLDKQLGFPKAKAYVALGAVAFYLLLIVFNFAGSLLTNLLGFVYPAYASFKAIESKQKDDDTQWQVHPSLADFLIFLFLCLSISMSLYFYAVSWFLSIFAVSHLHHPIDRPRRLTYWVVFAFFCTIEFFTDILLYWLPFYFLLKASVILYLALPQFQGAATLYTRFLRPILLQNMGHIDSGLGKAKKAAAQALADKDE